MAMWYKTRRVVSRTCFHPSFTSLAGFFFAASSRAQLLTFTPTLVQHLKMRFSLAAAALPVIASVVSAADILVQVGAGGKLAFSPSNITAAEGDVISFQFQGKNHSVTQSSFASPCSIQTTPAQGIDSGFQPVAPDATQLPQWSFTVTNASAPLWFFCAQTNPANHCNAGMVFAVNAKPDGEKSFAAWQALAMNGAAAAAASSVVDGATSAIAGAADTATSAIGGAIGDAGSAIGGAAGAATSAIGGAAGAAATDVANGLTAAAGQITGVFGSDAPTQSDAPSAGFAVSAKPVHFLVAFGLAAGLLL
ncbi:hypothetical protein MKEN_01048100 [Mycena kentingensis (nom. inval.)]|nr:hypothetical protein MKEN_01048100 [Mycena kentingensis (nom. inval.)]